MSRVGLLIILYVSQTLSAPETAERIWQTSEISDFSGPVQAIDEHAISQFSREESHGLSEYQQNSDSTFVARWNVTLVRRSNNIQYGTNNIQYGSNNIQYGENNIQYGEHNIQYGSRNIQYGQHNIQYGSRNIQYGSNNIQNGNNAIQYMDILNNITYEEENTEVARSKMPRLPLAEDIYFSKGLKDRSNEAVYFKVEKNVRTTAEDQFQNVRLITLKSSSPLQYNAEDSFMIRPRNCQEDIDDLFRIFNEHELDIVPGYTLDVEEMHDGMPVPPVLQTPLTIHRIAEQYWDLQAYPTQYVFSLLAQVSEDKLEKDKCIELSSPEGQEAWLNYSRTKRTILEVLRDFPKTTSKLTIPIFFELFSTIKPQSFAIASSNLRSPNSLELLVDVVENTTELQMPRKECSNWLQGLKEEDGVYGWIKKE